MKERYLSRRKIQCIGFSVKEEERARKKRAREHMAQRARSKPMEAQDKGRRKENGHYQNECRNK